MESIPDLSKNSVRVAASVFSLLLQDVSASIDKPTAPNAKDVTLIVRVKNHDDNPVSTVGIVKYESKKKERRWLMSESGLLSGTSVKTIVGNVKFEAKKYGESSYLITVKGLEPGEYGVYVSAVESASTFSVK